MAEYFQFKRTDPYITKKLSVHQIGSVTTWQTGNFDFSFHTLHEGGWPVYIVEEGQRGQRNRPKINVKDKTSGQAAVLAAETWSDKAVLKEAKEVIVANWAIFQNLADRFYEGEEEVVKVVGPRYVAEYKCETPNCKSRVITHEVASLQAFANAATKSASEALLPKCKQCRQKKWAFVKISQLVSGKPSIAMGVASKDIPATL